MADRIQVRFVVRDEAGNAIENAAISLFQPGTTTAPSGTMFSARTGGSVVVNPRLTNAQGEIEVWLSDKQSLELAVNDNSDLAHYPSDTARKLSWTEYREHYEAMPAPADIGGVGVTAHSALTGLAADDHPQYATDVAVTAEIAVHAAAADPHTVYATNAELTAHEAAANPHATYATDTDLSTHAGAADPHTGYQKESERGAASGYAPLGADSKVPTANLPASSADVTTHEAAADPHTGYRKEADEVVAVAAVDQALATASTALQNVTSLSFAYAAEETWLIDGVFFVDGSGTTTDFKAGLDVPANADVVIFNTFGPGSADAFDVTAFNSATADDTANLVIGLSATLIRAIRFTGVVMGADAGTVQLRAAQGASSAEVTTIKKGSWMRARRV